MRGIIILALIVLAMGLAGWLTFGRNSGRATINIETDKIRRDTATVMENTERMIDSGAQVLSGENSTDEAIIVEPHDDMVPAN